MTPMRFCRSLSARLATALAVATLLVIPRTHAADALLAPTAPAISAASTNSAPATNAVAPDLKTVPTTNSLPLPARDERGEGRSEISPNPNSRLDPQNNPPGGAPSIARPDAVGAPSGRAMLGAPINGDGNPQPPTNAPAAILPTNAPPTGVAQSVTNPLPPPVILPSAPAPAPGRSTATASRETKPPTPRIDFSTFKILTERNIFDPNRSSRGNRYSAPSSDTPPPARPPPPAVVETFTLVGTLAYGENQMAFIDGPSSQYKRALRLNDTIAGLKLKSVAANQAAFDNDGKEISLRIGHQLRREDRREWQVNAQPTTYASAPLAPSGTTNTSSASTTNSASGDTASPLAPGAAPVVAKPEPAPTAAEAEALRRLLEKRRKEEEK